MRTNQIHFHQLINTLSVESNKYMTTYIYKIELDFDDDDYQNFLEENLIEDDYDVVIERLISEIPFIDNCKVHYAVEKQEFIRISKNVIST